MTFSGKKATGILFLGDIVLFIFSLWLTLLVRFAAFPDAALFLVHLRAFAAIFALWLLIFYMAGLYSKRMILFKSKLPRSILRTQLLNIVLAALLFFFIPAFGITPKTILAIYLGISLMLTFVWRLWLFPRITRPSAREGAVLIGSGPEVDALAAEVNGNPRYNLKFLVVADPAKVAEGFDAFASEVADKPVSIFVIDAGNEKIRAALPRLYEFAFVSRRYQCIDFYTAYEEVFDRVPISLLRYEWVLQNLSISPAGFYEFLKRLVDILGGIAMGMVTVVVTPFVFIALRFEGPGPVFISQERLGQYGSRITSYKFRSMSRNDAASRAWVGEGENRVTRVGSFLRKTSLDEFPQCINILRGELSLIGPRNDIAGLGLRLAEAIPYYNSRYMVKPGITGWAQINQQYEQGNISPQSIGETKVRLAYDFYYIKHRSFALDIVIALRTVKRMLFRVSSW